MLLFGRQNKKNDKTETRAWCLHSKKWYLVLVQMITKKIVCKQTKKWKNKICFCGVKTIERFREKKWQKKEEIDYCIYECLSFMHNQKASKYVIHFAEISIVNWFEFRRNNCRVCTHSESHAHTDWADWVMRLEIDK